MSPTLHPALTVTNIKNFIPVTLDMDQSKYISWAELFRVHCEAFDCDDHLEATEPPKPVATTEASKATDEAVAAAADAAKLWKRIDAVVRQWIYGTISPDLLQTILKPGSTAHSAWTAIQGIFNDNKQTRALYLQNKFSNIKLDSFPNITAYCQSLKEISDQLTNVDAPVSDQRLVLQLIAGLNDQYDGVAMLLQQTTPLPDFHKARSQLILEETRKAKQTTNPPAALAVDHHKPNTPPPPPNPKPNPPPTAQYYNSPNNDQYHRGRGVGAPEDALCLVTAILTTHRAIHHLGPLHHTTHTLGILTHHLAHFPPYRLGPTITPLGPTLLASSDHTRKPT